MEFRSLSGGGGGGCSSVVVTLLILPEDLGSVMEWGKGRRNSSRLSYWEYYSGSLKLAQDISAVLLDESPA